MTRVLDTNESRTAHTRYVQYSTPIWGHEPPYGFVYVCPRCGWQSPGMKYREGGRLHGEQHALRCPA